MTALVGSHVVLECPLKFPDDEHVPYVIEWKKQVRPYGLYKFGPNCKDAAETEFTTRRK